MNPSIAICAKTNIFDFTLALLCDHCGCGKFADRGIQYVHYLQTCQFKNKPFEVKLFNDISILRQSLRELNKVVIKSVSIKRVISLNHYLGPSE